MTILYMDITSQTIDLRLPCSLLDYRPTSQVLLTESLNKPQTQ